MKPMHDFFLELNPPRVTGQMKGINFAQRRVYTKPAVLEAEQLFTWHLKRHAPKEPIKGAVSLTVSFFFGYSGKSHTDGEWKTTRPDTDNLIKVLKDTMTKMRFWEDDAQVAEETVRKQWSKIKPGIAIRIAAIGKGEEVTQ